MIESARSLHPVSDNGDGIACQGLSWDAECGERTVLIFGGESSGFPEAIRERWRDRLVGVPMADPALRSLNLSNTAAIALYEVLRRRAKA